MRSATRPLGGRATSVSVQGGRRSDVAVIRSVKSSGQFRRAVDVWL